MVKNNIFQLNSASSKGSTDVGKCLYYTERGGVLFYKLAKVRHTVMIFVAAYKAYR